MARVEISVFLRSRSCCEKWEGAFTLPYGLVGTSSLYKRESAPGGYVPKGSVTAIAPNPKRLTMNWGLQGGDAGIYDNSDIHAIRIVAQEPRTDIKGSGHGGAPL